MFETAFECEEFDVIDAPHTCNGGSMLIVIG